MKIKKLALLLAAFSMAVSITACGPKKASEQVQTPAESGTPTETTAATTEVKPEDGAKLVIWESKDERSFTDEIAKQFTAKYNVQVKIEEVAPTDQVTKLTQDGPSGLAADVVLFPHDSLGRAASANLVLPNDLFAEETTKNNTEIAIKGVTYNDVLYGYPRSAETYALYYNKSLVKEAPKSFDDVLAFGKTFTDKAKKKYGIMWETGNMYFNYPFIATTGGYIYGKEGTDKDDIGINSAGAVEGLKVYQSLKEVLPVKSGDITPDIKRSLFGSGDVAMDINGPWELAGYKAALGDKLGIAPIPSIGGQPAVSMAGVKGWYVNAYSKYPNAAKLFAQFASTKDAQLLLNEKVGSVPTNKEALESEQIKSDPYVSAFAEQTKSSQPMPSIPEMGNVWGPVNAALPEIWDNGKDPKATLDKAAQQIKDLNNGVKKD
ncbi:maltose ABC transporter substrate-binding protein [Paenibacillus sp. YPG26]|uniref:sugar ABC transporter substrate-binding protein n=1 Tax=Paenibacillus sp. YPG26 TaxID=2878915 RepID=UPI00203EC4EA|nr:maltose ABC transporter substrate-binding protein [Paenibacillus sp. YPG26]USB33672.1 maltose ABC transporter substrate-binding protein [Paenibacillus sp. YPG26]